MDMQLKQDPDVGNERNAMLGLYRNPSIHRGTVAPALMDLSVAKGFPANPHKSNECHVKIERKEIDDTPVELREIAKVEIKGEKKSDLRLNTTDRLLMSSSYRHNSTLRVQLDQKPDDQTIAPLLVGSHFDLSLADKMDSLLKSVHIPSKQTTETENPVYERNPPSNLANELQAKPDCSNKTPHGQDQANGSRIDQVQTTDTHDENTFICGECLSEFPTQFDLLDHIEHSHPDTAKEEIRSGGKKIQVCVMLIDERTFISYKRQVNPKRCFMCLTCDYACGRRRELLKHLQDHFAIRPYSCAECGRKFKTKSNLGYHLERHIEDKNHVCKICGAKFKGKNQLKKHVNQHGPFRCNDCWKMFENKSSYKNHVDSHKKVFTGNSLCEYCGKTFASRTILGIHLLNHGSTLVEKQFRCPQCEKLYANKFKLRDHIREIHKNPVVCDICGKQFRLSCILKTHMVRHHQATEPFVCEQCGRSFSTSHQLRTHALNHTGEKPFKCKECSAGFTRSDYLRKHELTHSGEKPYLCNVCGKGFSRKSNLNVHVKWHLRVSDKQK